jgi:hypothetical protein
LSQADSECCIICCTEEGFPRSGNEWLKENNENWLLQTTVHF